MRRRIARWLCPESPIRRIEVLRLEDGDQLVLTCPGDLSDGEIADISDGLRETFGPEHKPILLTGGLTLSVIHNGSTTA